MKKPMSPSQRMGELLGLLEKPHVGTPDSRSASSEPFHETYIQRKYVHFREALQFRYRQLGLLKLVLVLVKLFVKKG